ncbi:hypothetical protein Q1695_009743 [Nippostrongylus brasiliensis]|nr:hypothetical protein Q1695_009743 [Nippostrongylus brasiliensis]
MGANLTSITAHPDHHESSGAPGVGASDDHPTHHPGRHDYTDDSAHHTDGDHLTHSQHPTSPNEVRAGEHPPAKDEGTSGGGSNVVLISVGAGVGILILIIVIALIVVLVIIKKKKAREKRLSHALDEEERKRKERAEMKSKEQSSQPQPHHDDEEEDAPKGPKSVFNVDQLMNMLHRDKMDEMMRDKSVDANPKDVNKMVADLQKKRMEKLLAAEQPSAYQGP